MATDVKEVYYLGKEEGRLFVTDKEKINVVSATEGIVKTVFPSKNCDNFVSTLVGCLEETSNFNFFFNNYYRQDIKGFEFFFEGVEYLITKNSDPEKIKRKMAKNHVFQQRIEYKRQQLHKKILELDATTEIQFKDETAERHWRKLVAYAETLDELKSIAFARRYAKVMQALMLKHGVEKSHLISASIIDAIDKDGIVETTEMQFTFDTLKKIWAYGDDF